MKTFRFYDVSSLIYKIRFYTQIDSNKDMCLGLFLQGKDRCVCVCVCESFQIWANEREKER